MNTYEVHVIEWDEDNWRVDAVSPKDAAEKHVFDGWLNAGTQESWREPVTAEVDLDGVRTRWTVSWASGCAQAVPS